MQGSSYVSRHVRACAQCEGTYRATERFSARSMDVIRSTSWFSFRRAIADMLLLIYNAARVVVESQMSGVDLRAAFRQENVSETFIKSVLTKPKMRKDVHKLNCGVTGIGKSPSKTPFDHVYTFAYGCQGSAWSLWRLVYVVLHMISVLFFELRKLHQWRPQPAKNLKLPRSSAVGFTRVWMPSEEAKKNEDVSLVKQSLEAFGDIDMPPGWAAAAPELTVVNDRSASPAESVLLEKYASKRDEMMISLLRGSLKNLVDAFKGIFGLLEGLVHDASPDDRVPLCKLGDQAICFDDKEATKARLNVLHILLAAHLGVHVGQGRHDAGYTKELEQDFMSFLIDAAWFRFRPRLLRSFRRKSGWGLDLLTEYLFPGERSGQDSERPMTDDQLLRIRQAGNSGRLQLATTSATTRSRRSILLLPSPCVTVFSGLHQGGSDQERPTTCEDSRKAMSWRQNSRL